MSWFWAAAPSCFQFRDWPGVQEPLAPRGPLEFLLWKRRRNTRNCRLVFCRLVLLISVWRTDLTPSEHPNESELTGIRVVTYNVLSPTVCSEDSFPRCRSEDLQEALRPLVLFRHKTTRQAACSNSCFCFNWLHQRNAFGFNSLGAFLRFATRADKAPRRQQEEHAWILASNKTAIGCNGCESIYLTDYIDYMTI